MSELDPLEKLRIIVSAALERKAEDVLVLDVRKLTSFANAFVLVTGGSGRQVRSIADNVAAELKAHGEPAMGIEGLEEGTWVLLDCNDVIVHAFEEETRERYSLERLWHDAPRVELDLGERILDEGPAASREKAAQ